jgi:membrane-bound metal-dependent hydrolase YbcI (DUF457 family)
VDGLFLRPLKGAVLKAGGHVAVGAAVACFALLALQSSGVEPPRDVLLVGALVGGVGALVPDIDHPGSTVSRGVPRRLLLAALRVALALAVVTAAPLALGHSELVGQALDSGRPLLRFAGLLVLLAFVLVLVSLLISRVFGHRGATHSLVFAAGAGLFVAATCARAGLSPWYGALFGLGWVSHLAADALGRRGLPSLLWPLLGRR